MHRALLTILFVIAAASCCGHTTPPSESRSAPSQVDAGDQVTGYPIWGRTIAPWRPTDIPGLQFWITAEDAATDQFVARLPDNSGKGRAVTGGNNAQSPRVNLAGVLGRPAMVFSSTAQQYMPTDTQRVSEWRFLHNGGGFTAVVVVRPMGTSLAQAIFDTSSFIAAGTTLSHNAKRGRWTLTIRNGSGVILSLATPDGSAPVDTDQILAVTYSERDTPKATIRINGVVVATGNTSGTPAAGDSHSWFALGRLSGTGLQYFDGYLRSMVLYDRTLSASELAAVEGGLPRMESTRTLLVVWPVGDSNTSTTYQDTINIRAKASSGFRVNFVGQQYGGEVSLFPDRQHDGWVAYTVAGIQAQVTGAKLDAEPTHILTMAAANDLGSDAIDIAALKQRYRVFHDLLRREHPTSRILVGRPIRRRSGTAGAIATETFAAWVPTFVATQMTNAEYVPTDVTSDDELSDNVHMTTTGAAVVGGIWSTALGF